MKRYNKIKKFNKFINESIDLKNIIIYEKI